MSTQTKDYADFDQKMLSLIEAGTNTAAALIHALDAEAKALTTKAGEEFRVIDRRLQALRKKGLIIWERHGSQVVWVVVRFKG